MNLEDLRLFVDVARQGGFVAAARSRGVDPSAISRAIAALEARLGVRLFQRTTRKVSLTEAGAVFLDRIETLLTDFDGARDDARSVAKGPSGVLRLTASNAFGPICIAPLLGAFREAYPKVSIELLLSDETLDLVASRIDLAVRLGPAVGPGLVGVKLFDTRYRVCASKAYLQTAPVHKPSALSEHRCLLFSLANFRTRWTFLSACGDSQNVSVAGDLVSSSALSLRAAALAGMGPALLPNWLIDADIARGDLVDVFPDYRITATTFDTAAWLVYPSRKYLPAKVKAMSDFLSKELLTRFESI